MKEKKLLEALGEVNEGYIEETYATAPIKRKPKLKLLWAAAAALCAIALLTGSSWIRIYWATSDLHNYPLIDPAQVSQNNIRLTATEVTATSMRVYCTVEGVEEENAIYLQYNGPFTIDKKTENGWEPLTPRFTDLQWKADPMLTGGTTDWPVDWSGLYGLLEPGTYRYSAVVLEGKAPSSVEFIVAGELDEELAMLLRTTLNSRSYCVRYRATAETGSLDHLNATDRAVIEENTEDYVAEYWRYGNHQLKLSYHEDRLALGMMYKEGHAYCLDYEGDDRRNPVLGWSRWPQLERNRLEEWVGLILNSGEYEIRDAADGSGKELVQVTEKVFENGGVTVRWTNVWELDISDPGACADALAKQNVNAARPFSWELDRETQKPLSVTFANTECQSITTAPEAVDRALEEYTGEFSKAIVYRDEKAGMWKVEFLRDYGYQGYHFVYLNDDGITQMIAEGEVKFS